MKNYSSLPLLGAALGLAAFTASCSDRSTTGDTNAPAKTAANTTATAPANTTAATTGTTITPAPMASSAFSSAATDISTAGATAIWNDLKTLPFERRAELSAGVTRLENEVSNQAAALKAKRATMAGTTDTQAWDFAMKGMVDAQIYLKSTAAELDKSTAETWEQTKEKVGQAWTRAQEAYGKVNASTTK